MRNKLVSNYKKFSNIKKKQSVLKRFFSAFLPEAVYRNTKIEHPDVSRNEILSFLR